jgi:hypothetical protein
MISLRLVLEPDARDPSKEPANAPAVDRGEVRGEEGLGCWALSPSVAVSE